MTSVSSNPVLPEINFGITEKNIKMIGQENNRFLLRIVTENGTRMLKLEPRYSLRTLWHLIFDRQSFKVKRIIDEVMNTSNKGRTIGTATRQVLNGIIRNFNDKQDRRLFFKKEKLSLFQDPTKKVSFAETVEVKEFYVEDAPEEVQTSPSYSQKTDFSPKPRPVPKSLKIEEQS